MAQSGGSLYGEQKKTKPSAEEIIPEVLSSNQAEAAADFVKYLRESGMNPIWGSGNSWKVSYKGKGVLYIKLDQSGANSWWVNPMTGYTDEYIEFVGREGLAEVIWRNLATCTRCHPRTCSKAVLPAEDEDSFCGIKKTYFGREFGGICRGGDTSFRNPDGESMDCLKKIIDFRRHVIESGEVPKVRYMSPKRRVSVTEIIELQEDIHVVGLSLRATGLAEAGDLWSAYTDAHRLETCARVPIVEYGIWMLGDGRDYLVGSAVTGAGAVPEGQAAVVIPAGRYIRDTFNAVDFEQLVTETLPGREAVVDAWAKEMGVDVGTPSMFIEVYPVQEMAGENAADGSFARDARLKARYPQMYTLLPV